MKVFILEDDYTRMKLFREALFEKADVVHAANVNKAVDLYEQHKPFDLLLLDHDLETYFMSEVELNTGTKFVKWLIDTEQEHVKEVIIHSYNLDGAVRMEKMLQADGWPVVGRVPFGMSLLKALEVVSRRD
jgi:CheY-like chemotaxis protein